MGYPTRLEGTGEVGERIRMKPDASTAVERINQGEDLMEEFCESWIVAFAGWKGVWIAGRQGGREEEFFPSSKKN